MGSFVADDRVSPASLITAMMINYRYPAARAGRKQLSVYWQRTRRMTPAVLFVTTSLYGQPTTNSQTRFESMEACEDARIKLIRMRRTCAVRRKQRR